MLHKPSTKHCEIELRYDRCDMATTSQSKSTPSSNKNQGATEKITSIFTSANNVNDTVQIWFFAGEKPQEKETVLNHAQLAYKGAAVS